MILNVKILTKITIKKMNLGRIIFLAITSTFLLLSCVEDDMVDYNLKSSKEQSVNAPRILAKDIKVIASDTIQAQNQSQVENDDDTDSDGEPCRPWYCNKIE